MLFLLIKVVLLPLCKMHVAYKLPLWFRDEQEQEKNNIQRKKNTYTFTPVNYPWEQNNNTFPRRNNITFYFYWPGSDKNEKKNGCNLV